MNREKVKIAFVTPKMIIGGAETYVINKSEWLVRHGFEVLVISEGGENVKNLPADVSHIVLKGISQTPLGFSNKEYCLFIEKFKSILIDNKVTVIEAHNTAPIVHVALVYKHTKIPFLINILNELSYLRNPLLIIITKKLDVFRLVYVLTLEMNQYIERIVKRKVNSTIIPIPVKPILTDDLNHDKKYILSVSRLSDDKYYVKYLIEDFYELYKSSDKFLDYKLVIVGEGSCYNELNSLKNSINKEVNKEIVELRGTLFGNDLVDVYKNCTCFVGMGTTLLLAASCKKTAIIAGFTSETNKFSWGFWGENELDSNIMAIGSAENRIKTSFQTSITLVVESEKRRISSGEAAYKMFKKNYDYISIMTLWEKEYQKVIDVFKLKEYDIQKRIENYDSYRFFYQKIRQVFKVFKL